MAEALRPGFSIVSINTSQAFSICLILTAFERLGKKKGCFKFMHKVTDDSVLKEIPLSFE